MVEENEKKKPQRSVGHHHARQHMHNMHMQFCIMHNAEF